MFVCVANESLWYEFNILVIISHSVMVIKNNLSDSDVQPMEQLVTTFVPTLAFNAACLRVFEVHSQFLKECRQLTDNTQTAALCGVQCTVCNPGKSST